MSEKKQTEENNTQQVVPAPTSISNSMKTVQSAPVLTKVEFSCNQTMKDAEKRNGNND